MVACGIVGLLRSFSNDYAMFILLEFLDPFVGAGGFSAGFILAIELVGPARRMLGGALISSSFATGEIILGLIAWQVQSWRTLLQIIYTPAIFFIAYLWIIPESVRWLAVQGRVEDLAKILKKMAKTNKVVLSEHAMECLDPASKQLSAVSSSNTAIAPHRDDEGPFQKLVKSPVLMVRVLNCSFCWMSIMFVFYGLSMNSVAVAGNKYLNFVLVSLIEIPAYFLMYLIANRVGRRICLSTSLLVTGGACLSTLLFQNAGIAWLRLVVYLIGKFSITICMSVMYVYCTELFPTTIRNSMVGFCSMFGRCGTMIAAQMPLLALHMKSLPLILFGGSAITAGILLLQLPETLNAKLPDSIEEAENIGNKRNTDESYL